MPLVPQQPPAHETPSQEQVLDAHLHTPLTQWRPAAQAAPAPQIHAPAGEQPSAVAASQATQVPPPVPQVAADREVQMPPAQQPLGQLCALHTQAPLEQAVPAGQRPGLLPQRHVPLTGSQRSALTASQPAQVSPPTPQVASAGEWQTPLAQQPVGQDAGLHTQSPATQLVPAPHAGLAPQRHSPAIPQLSAIAGSQVRHAAPPDPQVTSD
jgi:hypothetical protein